MWVGLALVLLFLAGLATSRWPTDAEREATRWLQDFHKVRASDGDQRLPDWPLSYEGQRVLVRRLTVPESRIAGIWEAARQALPANVRGAVPRFSPAANRLRELGPVLIEMPMSPAIRSALLESALDPRGSNRRFAVQFACASWPVSRTLLPLLEPLAMDPDPAVRTQVAVALRGMPPGDPAVEKVLGRLQADQVAVVREAARYSYRSDPTGARVPGPSDHATPPE